LFKTNKKKGIAKLDWDSKFFEFLAGVLYTEKTHLI